MHTKTDLISGSKNQYLFLFSALTLLFLFGILALVSQQFVYGEGHAERPIIAFLLIISAAFLIYIWAVWSSIKGPWQASAFVIIGFAILFRIIFFFSNPIQENDFYRYLWDGRVVAAGINPYLTSPDGIDDNTDKNVLVEKLRKLRDSDPYLKETVFPRIGHSEVKTIYPPVAQAVFAGVGVLKGKTIILQSFLLMFDLACMVLLVLLLRQMGLPDQRVLIYAWSPVIIKEFANSMHMDVIPIAFMLAALLLALKDRWILATLFLAMATLAKFFPVLLLPFFLKRLWAQDRKQAWYAVVIFGLVVTAGFLPFLEENLYLFSGLITYAQIWEMNAPVFSALSFLTKLGASIVGIGGNHALYARILSGVLIGVVILVCTLRQKQTHEAIVRSCLITMAALFFLGPTSYPWYFAWVLCLCALVPVRALILCAGLIPIYYLRFYYSYRGDDAFFNNVIIWIEFAPIYLLLIWDMILRNNLSFMKTKQLGVV
jgi:hypothetical protein